ncbi:MAG: HD domain-containing phosphohydrolase, partial [Candidatus Caldatribacteriaceae bacterium]
SINEKGALVGISVDFWKRFEEKTGVQVALVPMEWNMAHQVMLRKEAEVIDTLFYTPERDQYLDYTRPIFPITSSIYYRKNLAITSFQDLTPHIVGAKERDALLDIARRENPAIQFRLYKNYSDIVEAAKRREIQVFLMDDPPANYYLVKQGLLYEFARTSISVSNFFYLATWEGNEEVLATLNEGLAQFSDEELRALAREYVTEVEHHPPWLWKVITLMVVFSALLFLILSLLNRFLKRKVAQATRELADKNQALEEAKRKLFQTIEVVSSLPLFEMKEEEFFSRILDLALEIIPKARYGSVLLLGKDGKGKLVVLRGHDEGLQGFTFEPQELLAKEQATIIKNILDPQRPFTSPENYKKLVRLSKPIAESLIIPLWWEGQLFGQLDLDIPRESDDHFIETDVAMMENFARICTAFHALRVYAQKEETFLEKLLLVLMKALEYHDRSTRGHSETSARYVLWIARKLHLDPERSRRLYWATFVHDVGKIFIPQEILNKPEKLTDKEYALVKLHPLKSAELILGVKGLEDIAKIIRHHHERWDGMGYPDGLRGEAIPLESRIIAVVDAFE